MVSHSKGGGDVRLFETSKSRKLRSLLPAEREEQGGRESKPMERSNACEQINTVRGVLWLKGISATAAVKNTCVIKGFSALRKAERGA